MNTFQIVNRSRLANELAQWATDLREHGGPARLCWMRPIAANSQAFGDPCKS